MNQLETPETEVMVEDPKKARKKNNNNKHKYLLPHVIFDRNHSSAFY